MALLFIDSFDHFLDASDKYLAGSSASVPGRHGQGWSGSVRCALNSTSARVIVGGAFRFGSTFQQFIGIADAGISVETTNSGALRVALFGGPDVKSAVDAVRVGQWHFIECDFTIFITETPPYWHYNVGPCKVYLDGALVIDAATLGPGIIKDAPPAFPYWTHIDLMGNAYGTMDDLYISDGSGPAPYNAPLGDIEISVIRPNGPGALSQWTSVGASPNWNAVNDPTPDDETTYVSAAAAGLSDLYEMENINTNDGIIGAQLLINARRTEEGFANLAPLLRHAGVTTALPERAISPTYFYRNRQVFVTMPNGDPLTDANVNALQAGMRRTL